MRFHRLDLNRLVALDALLEHCSVSKAAVCLHISQPAMSGALAALRDHFGDPLLLSAGRRMRRTSFAESLVLPVRDLLLQMQAIASRRPGQAAGDITRSMSVAGSDVAGVLLLPALLRMARREAPGLRFEILPASPRSNQELERGDIDLLIGPDPILAASHPREILFVSPYACIVWRDAPYTEDNFDIAAFSQAEHVSLHDGYSRSIIDDAVFQACGRRPMTVASLTAFTLFPHFVMDTERVATLPRQMAEKIALQQAVRVLACPVAVEPLRYCVQWHARQEADVAIRWARDALRRLSLAEML